MTNEEKALEIKHNDPCCVWNDGCPNVYNAALEMAKWKDEHPSKAWLDKVCRWLEENMEDYTEWFDYDEGECQHLAVSSDYDYKRDFIEALRKAMEE